MLNLADPAVLRSAWVIGLSTVAFALLLWWADRRGRQTRSEHELAWRDVLLIGLAQTLSLIPGTSRSGITITAAMALGLTRSAAARFSFLLSVPIITAAGALKTVEVVQAQHSAHWPSLILGALLAAISALPVYRLVPAADRADRHAALRALPARARSADPRAHARLTLLSQLRREWVRINPKRVLGSRRPR